MKITKKQLQEAVKQVIDEELTLSEGPKMTRQLSQMIADVLKDNNAPGPLVQAFADALERTNPGFDAGRFLQAAKGSYSDFDADYKDEPDDADREPMSLKQFKARQKGSPWE